MMNLTCFVCNACIPFKNDINIFNETVSEGTTLAGFLGSLFETNVSKDNAHSQAICEKCHSLCVEYQDMQLKLQETKNDLLTHFKSTQNKLQLSHETYNLTSTMTQPVEKIRDKPMARLVLPASRLQPLPSNYIINVDKLITSSRKPQVVSISSSHIMTNTTTYFSQGQIMPTYTFHESGKTPAISNVENKDTNGKITTENRELSEGLTKITNIDTEFIDQDTETIVPDDSLTKKSSMIDFDINTLPKDFLDSDKIYSQPEAESSEDFDDDQELPMEIDEDCKYVRIPAASTNLSIHDNSGNDSEISPNYVTFEVLANDSSSVLGTVKLLQQQCKENEDTEEDQQTIVMQDENGSLLQLVSGQKLVYSGGDLTLLMPSDQDDDGDENDSNDESQIELQVSDDEETAKAIIAAASEQGGAFIKVESGEMFRVKSVISTPIEDNEDNSETPPACEMVKENNGMFTCLLCNNSTKGQEAELIVPVVGNAETIMQHLKSQHNARLYICWVCNRILRRRADLVSHFETHEVSHTATVDKTKQYICNTCNKKYSSKALLQEHMNIHNGKRPYACPICDKTFTSKYTHQAHVKTHSERPRPYKCGLCPKAFLTQQNLAQHEKIHTGVKDFVCNTCGKAFATQHNLEVHLVVHLGMKPFACDTCGKAFARRNEVKDHMRIHTGERPFVCDICGAAFSQRSNLGSHKSATHLNVSRYHCNQCPKKFKRRRLLDYHLKATHTGERPLVCEICNATFVYPEHYRKHQRIHSGEKPYDCEVCGKTFNSRDNRNTHRFVHSDKKPYECLVCGTGYMRKQLLYAHMNTSGHLAESIVVNQPRVQKVHTRDKLALGSKGLEIVPDNDDNIEGDEVTKIYVTDPNNDKNYVLLNVGQHAPGSLDIERIHSL